MESTTHECIFYYLSAFHTYYENKKLSKLPVNFHENILNLENMLFFRNNYENFDELLNLYKVKITLLIVWC